jgi:integrase
MATPEGLIRRNLENVFKSDAVDVARKREATDWLFEFIQRGGVSGAGGNSYRKCAASAVFSFYKRNDSPLFGDFKVPIDNYEEPKAALVEIEMAKKFISILPLRAKLAALIEFQSGLRVCDIVNLKWKQLMASYGKGEVPLKIEGLRNDNGRGFYSFLGQDAVTILGIYLKYRRNLVGRDIEPEDYLLVREGKATGSKDPVEPTYIQRQIRLSALNAKFCEKKDGKHHRYAYRTHLFRHLFKTECGHAGINPMISEFFMGHDKGIEYVYNHQHEIHPEDFIALYKKVEPYLSISHLKPVEINEQTIARALQNNPALASTIAREVFKDREAVREFFGRLVDEGLIISATKPQEAPPARGTA